MTNPFANTEYTDHMRNAVQYVVPEAILVGTACVLFLLAAFRAGRGFAHFVAFAGLIAAAVVGFNCSEAAITEKSLAPIDPSGLAAVVRIIAFAALGIYLILGWSDTNNSNGCEYTACLLVVSAGVSFVGRANDLLSLFIALEMVSIPTYILLYLPSSNRVGQESSLKYFLLSILSSGFLLFGFSYLFGLIGSLNLVTITEVLSKAKYDGVSMMAVVAAVMVIAGLGFRIAAVPFHFYAPDVYQGGPLGVVSQLAFYPKVAGFIALIRVLGLNNPTNTEVMFDTTRTLIPLCLWVIAAITMTFGNILALLQDNVKRLIAYSGIAHTGYMLLGILMALSPGGKGMAGIDAILFYTIAYGLMTLGLFAILNYLASIGSPVETVEDFAGLGKSNPFAAGLLTVSLLSYIGLPLTAGFWGKFNLFVGTFQTAGNGETGSESPMKFLYYLIVLIAAVNAGIAAVYYLRMLGIVYLRTPLKPTATCGCRMSILVAIVCAVGTVGVGIYPKPLMEAIQNTTKRM